MTSARPFPDGFLFGAATASYQVEGAVTEDGRGPSIWDTFSATPGKVLGGDTGEVACDQYHRWPEDMNLVRDLGIGAYRFSVAWPRVQPAGRGQVNQAGLDHYRLLVEGMLERGIAPALTLYHWDLPQPLQDSGGWASRDTVDRFVEYADIVAKALGNVVPQWITLNEPWVSAYLGYGVGRHAPGIQDGAQAVAANHHLLLAHGRAVPVLRAALPAEAHVGITLNLNPVVPVTDDPADLAAARRVDGNGARMFLDPLLRGAYPADMVTWYGAAMDVVQDGDLAEIAAPIDFLGVNHYFRTHVRAHPEPVDGPQVLPALDAVEVSPDLPKTTMGWAIEPDGMRELLVRLHADYSNLPPVYITENGAAMPDVLSPDGSVPDDDRIAYLKGYLGGLLDAVDAGVDVRGYFAWSLLDNFEWAEGYSQRFGLVRVDYDTQVRTPKASAHWYSEVARSGVLPA